MAAIQLTGASLRGHGRRLTSALLAITLAVAFVATTLLVSDSLQQRFTRDARAAVLDGNGKVGRAVRNLDRDEAGRHMGRRVVEADEVEAEQAQRLPGDPRLVAAGRPCEASAQRQPGQERPAPTVGVTDPAAGDQRRTQRQGVGGDHPLQLSRRGAQRGLNVRGGDRHDGHVHQVHERGNQNDPDDRTGRGHSRKTLCAITKTIQRPKKNTSGK